MIASIHLRIAPDEAVPSLTIARFFKLAEKLEFPPDALRAEPIRQPLTWGKAALNADRRPWNRIFPAIHRQQNAHWQRA